MLEETGLRVDVGRLVGTVERDAPGGGVYVIRDYACRPATGADAAAVRAGDDADDAAWFTADEVRASTAPRAWSRRSPPGTCSAVTRVTRLTHVTKVTQGH